MAKHNIKIELTTTQYEMLEHLMRQSHLDTPKELFDNAVTIFEWAIQQVKRGNQIISLTINEEDAEYEEFIMPVFDRIKKQDKQSFRSVSARPYEHKTAHASA